MTKQSPKVYRPKTFKNVSMGHGVQINDQFLQENDQRRRVEAIIHNTMANAESEVQQLLANAQAEAEAIVAKAHQEAQELIIQAQQQQAAIAQEAHQEGLKQGHQEARQQIEAELTAQIAATDQIVSTVLEADEQRMAMLTTDMVSIIRSILQLIMAQQVTLSQEQMAFLIQQAVIQHKLRGEVTVLLNPDTLANLQSSSETIAEALEGLQKITLKAHPYCGPMDMYLETQDCTLDVSPEHLMENYLKVINTELNTQVTQNTAPNTSGDSSDDPESL